MIRVGSLCHSYSRGYYEGCGINHVASGRQLQASAGGMWPLLGTNHVECMHNDAVAFEPTAFIDVVFIQVSELFMEQLSSVKKDEINVAKASELELAALR